MISTPVTRFPRAVREPPRRKLLWGLTWTRLSRWSRRPPFLSTEGYQNKIIYFKGYTMIGDGV